MFKNKNADIYDVT